MELMSRWYERRRETIAAGPSRAPREGVRSG
jgi:hypothetical protein